MVSILLMALKVVGIILIALISLIILIVLIVLFVPVKYEAEGAKNEEIIVTAGITWLLRLIKVELLYDKDIKYRVKILWKVIIQKGYKDKKKSTNKSDKQNKSMIKTRIKRGDKHDKPEYNYSNINKSNVQVNIEPINKNSEESKNIRNIGNKEEQGNICDRINVEEAKNEEKSQQIKNKHKKDNETKKNNRFKEKNKGKIKKKNNEYPSDKTNSVKEIFNKIREFNKDESYKGVIKFLWYHLKKVIKSILPKKTKIELEYGLNDPMMTGLSLGVISIFYAVLGNSMVIKPDFNQQMLKGRVYVKGRIYLFIIAYHAILVILDKRVKKLKDEFKN